MICVCRTDVFFFLDNILFRIHFSWVIIIIVRKLSDNDSKLRNKLFICNMKIIDGID